MPRSASITIRVPTMLRERCGGQAVLLLAAKDVRAVLEDLERRYPELHRCVCDETGSVRRHVNLFVNRTQLSRNGGLDTELASGDVVTILPAVSGG